MSRRDLKRIRQSLIEQYNVWRKGDGSSFDSDIGGIRGPTMSPGFIGPGGQEFGGGARGRAATSATATQKPRVSVATAKELGIIKPDPKVWRRGSAKKSDIEQKTISADKSGKQKIPDPLTSKEKRSAAYKSAGLHAAAAAAAIYGLNSQRDKDTGNLSSDTDDSGVTWVDTKDIVPKSPDKKIELTPAASSPNEKVITTTLPSDWETPSGPKNNKVLPSSDNTGISAVDSTITTTSTPIAADRAPEPAGVPGSDNGTGRTVGYWDLYMKREQEAKAQRNRELNERKSQLEHKLYEKYTNFDNRETAKEKFLQKVIGPESGGIPWAKNPRSSATGLFQFIEPTWNSVVAKAKPGDPHYGVSFKEMPRNIAAQQAAAKQIADEYAKTIRRAGLPDVPTSYYLLHGHGPKAVEIYKNPEKQLKDIYPEYVKNKKGQMVKNVVYKQNPNFNPNQRLADFVAAQARQMGDRLTDVFPGANAGELPKVPATTTTRKIPVATSRYSADKELDSGRIDTKPVDTKPIGTQVQPDWSKYQYGDQGILIKNAQGKWTTLDGKKTATDPKLVADLEKLDQYVPPESFIDKVKKILPPALGGRGELASKVFAPEKIPPSKKSVSSALSPSVTPSPVSVVDKKPSVDLQKDQVAPMKIKRELSDFEKAFAAARAEKGAGQTFDWTNPRTGKTSTYTTSYRSETPTAKIKQQSGDVDTLTIKTLAGKTEPTTPKLPVEQLYKDLKDFDRRPTIDKPTGTLMPTSAEKLSSDELWKDIRQEWNALSDKEQATRVTDAKNSLYNDKIQSSDLKESINTKSRVELQDILRLAGMTK